MNENQLHHGVISKGKIRRTLRRASRAQLGRAGIPFDWTKTIPIPKVKIKDQQTSSSCGGQAGGYFDGVINKRLSNQDIEFSAKSIYAPIAYPQGGTTVYALEQQMATKGVNFESDVPSYQFAGFTNEAWMTNKAYLTPDIAYKALRDAHRVPMSVHIDIESMAQAIRDYGAIIIEVNGKNGEIPGWLSPIPHFPTNSNPNPLWAHFVCGAGVSIVNGKKQIDFYNSWGEVVGDKGVQHFTEEYINSGYIIDCFTLYPRGIQDTAGTSFGTFLLNFYRRALRYFLT